MKLAIVGTSKALENDHFNEFIEGTLAHFKPTLVILTPNVRFNAAVKEICARNGVPVDEMTPAKATWLGPSAYGARKSKIRDLRGFYIASRADALVIMNEPGAKGVAYQEIVPRVEDAKKPIYYQYVS